ncbi:hypothetical protein SD81_016685 [Tolypothrix campylonemoides VB511288]|nr:hypothetical protein SD81_016685 [Tolypothrix campylonemoides VB511288]
MSARHDTTPPGGLDPALRRRNRLLLVAIAAIFLGSFALAGALRFAGWRPAGMKNHGEMLDPPGDARALTPTLVEGGAYAWNPVERRWRIAVAPPAGCTTDCQRLAADLEKVRLLFGQDAPDVDILWIGDYPAGARRIAGLRQVRDDAALRAALPRSDDPRGTPLYVIDPNGFVILRYAPGADPGQLRSDLAKLLKLR